MRALYCIHWFALLLLLGQVFQVSGSASSANTTYENITLHTFSSGYSTLNCTITHLVNSLTSIESVGQRASVVSINNSTTSYPRLSLTMAIEVSSSVQVFIKVSNIGNGSAHSVLVRVDLTEGLKAYYGSFSNSSNITYSDRLNFNWNIGVLNENASDSLSFEAEASKDILQAGFNYFDAYCTYKGSWNGSVEYGPFIAEVGLKRVNTYKSSLFYQQGFTALAFFMALILGFLLVILGFFIYFMIRRKKMVSPDPGANDKKLLRNKGRQIMLSENEALKKGGHTIHGFSSVSADESIVTILGMRDKIQMHREIDSSDIVSTIDVDTSIEEERNNVSDVVTVLLIQGFRLNNDITKAQEDAVISNYKRKRSQMDKTQDDEYQRELKKLYKKIAAKNRRMINQLQTQQEAEKRKDIDRLQGVTEKEQGEVFKQLDQQYKKEKDEKIYHLKLKQAKKTEKLRKKFTIKKQKVVKDLHLEVIKEIKEHGSLNREDAISLMRKHRKNQKKLGKRFDEEISRQRMELEEKLARRKNLAHKSEVHEADEEHILEKMESQQVALLKQLKKKNVVSETEADTLIQEAKQQVLAIKDRFDKEKLRQEEELHKRLSDLKKQRLTEDAKKHKIILDDFDKEHQAKQTEKADDPITYAENRLQLLSKQLESNNTLENDLDEQHAKEMIILHKKTDEEMENEVRQAWTRLREKLPLDGSIRDSINSLLNKHDEDLRKLKVDQDKNRQDQEDKFRERLAKNRESRNQRMEAEKCEQQKLRDCEERISGKLKCCQVEMSDEDRDRILEEHEKHKVKLENNLALNKLRQMQMMEEKLAQKRAQRLEELQQEQEVHRQHADDNNAEESNEDARKDKVELMKEQIKKKLSIFQEEIVDWSDEMEKIQAEMVAERSLVLFKQEEQLETMIAELQLKRKKEIVTIKKQQQKISRLNASLAEELNKEGTLNKPECQAFLKEHLKLNEQLAGQIENKNKQADERIQKELEKRSAKREKTMLEPSDAEYQNPANMKVADKWKKLFHINKHMEDMENLRKELERQKRVKLEKFEKKRKRALEKQELVLLIELVKSGKISKEELNNILGILHPDETDAVISDILEKIYDPSRMEKDGNTSQHTKTKKKKKKPKKLTLAPESHNGTEEAHDMDEGIVEAEMGQKPLPVRLPPL